MYFTDLKQFVKWHMPKLFIQKKIKSYATYRPCSFIHICKWWIKNLGYMVSYGYSRKFLKQNPQSFESRKFPGISRKFLFRKKIWDTGKKIPGNFLGIPGNFLGYSHFAKDSRKFLGIQPFRKKIPGILWNWYILFMWFNKYMIQNKYSFHYI